MCSLLGGVLVAFLLIIPLLCVCLDRFQSQVDAAAQTIGSLIVNSDLQSSVGHRAAIDMGIQVPIIGVGDVAR